MKTKIFVLIIVGLFILGVKAQECGTKMPAGYMQKKFAVMSTGTYYPQDTCLNRQLSIVFHVVLDSNMQPGFNIAELDTIIKNLNKYFKPICISFKSCSTDYIPNYNYNEWEDAAHEPPVFGNYYADSTINIYIVDAIITPANAGGYAFMPGGPDAIILSKSSLTGLTPVHEMGHFFGLPHTFETSAGAEQVPRTGCYTSGDGFCDTEADPYPIGEVIGGATCDYVYGPVDGNGLYYTPPVDNIMTYFEPCRCRFTQEQYNYMAYIYVTSRTYLH